MHSDFASSIIFSETGWFGGLPPFSGPEESGKTALFLRGSLSISLAEVPALSTSPNMAKSQEVLAMFTQPASSEWSNCEWAQPSGRAQRNSGLRLREPQEPMTADGIPLRNVVRF